MSGMAASWGWCVDVRGGNVTERAPIKGRKAWVDLQNSGAIQRRLRFSFKARRPGERK